MYLISYDLKRVKNYPKLYECLNGWKAQRIHESLWAANLRGGCREIVQVLMGFIDGDDAIAVFELKHGADWASLRSRTGGVNLLRSYVGSADTPAPPLNAFRR